jgi:hypothetical protein
MVINKTSAVATIIHAVSPESTFGAGTAAAAVAASCANVATDVKLVKTRGNPIYVKNFFIMIYCFLISQ